VFANDPTIMDVERLFRRIHPSQLVPDERTPGKRRISSGAFRNEELSIAIESTVATSGRQSPDVLRNYPDHALVAITAGKARSHNQKVARDPEPDEPAHGVVFGKKRNCASALAESAEWIVPTSAPPL